MKFQFTAVARSTLVVCRRRRARRFRRIGSGAGQGRCQAARGAGRQDRLDRSAVGPDGTGRQQPAQQLEVHGREVQRQQRRRREVRGPGHRQQALADRDAERAQVGHRPGRALHRPGQWLVGWPRADRRHQQVQRAQPRQGSDLPQRGGRRSGPDQQQVQLLALPLRRRHDHEDGGHDFLHQGSEGRQEGLHPRPELLARRPGRQVREGRPEEEAPRHRDRRRGPAPDRAGSRLRALHRQDQGVGRRHRHHRQLGLRPDAC